jgi:hypothetical protein
MMRAALFAALLAVSPGAFACGYCVEDKIAAVYDHASIAKAIGQRHPVVFFAIEGNLKQDDATRRQIDAIAASAPGVDPGSVRISLDAASLAIAFDPRRTSLVMVQRALERKLAALGLSLLAMRIMETSGELAAVRRR